MRYNGLMVTEAHVQDTGQVFAEVKTRLSTLLARNNYEKDAIDGFLSKVDQVSRHDAFQGRSATEIITGIEHTIKKAGSTLVGAGQKPSHANVVSLGKRDSRTLFAPLEHITAEDLTVATATSHADKLSRKPGRNIVEEMQQRNKEQAAKPKKPYSKGPDFTVEQDVNFKGLQKPISTLAFGLTAVVAGYSVLHGVKTALEQGVTKKEDGTTQTNTGMMALAGAEVLFGVGLAALSYHFSKGMTR